MDNNSIKSYYGSPAFSQVWQNIDYLNEKQLKILTGKFRDFYNKAPGPRVARIRGRYFLMFLFLRYTGARISEVAGIDDQVDVDYRSADVTLAVLKRHNPHKKNMRKMIPVPLQAVTKLARYLARYPEMKGKAFSIDRSNFFRLFQKLTLECGFSKTLAHPHVLRHTRAMELVRAGVPLTIVQQILGHSNLNTTAVYLQFSGQEAKAILKDRGLI
ncbi:MAG: site-specific integrase [Candidatus Aminicenantes bacterium]|nr:site-specific integrase [Candidatus Aminicenantes bacterium]